MFRIDAGSGVPIYRQLVEQVRRAVMLGRLAAGDQLPPLREVVDALAINPNTVVKAYASSSIRGWWYGAREWARSSPRSRPPVRWLRRRRYAMR